MISIVSKPCLHLFSFDPWLLRENLKRAGAEGL